MIAVVQKWPILIILALGRADPQIPYPVPYPAMVPMPPPPPQQIAVPVAVPVPYGIPIPEQTKKSESTTTTCGPKQPEKPEEDNDSEQSTVKIVIPWPPFHWPPIMPKPPQLPFDNDNFTLRFPPSFPFPPPGFPIPFPVPAPPPVIMVPFPPIIRKPHHKSDHHKPDRRPGGERPRGHSSSSESRSTSDSGSSSSSSDSDSSKDYSRKKKKKKYGVYRSHRKFMTNEIKPVLSFLSKNGDVKVQKRLTMRDASLLLNKARDTVQKMRVVTSEDEHSRERRVVVMAHTAPKKEINNLNAALNDRKKLVIAKTAVDGRKVLVFNPPQDKTVTNLTLTFNLQK